MTSGMNEATRDRQEHTLAEWVRTSRGRPDGDALPGRGADGSTPDLEKELDKMIDQRDQAIKILLHLRGDGRHGLDEVHLGTLDVAVGVLLGE